MTLERKERTFKQVEDPEGESGGPITLLVSTDAMDDEGDVVEQSWAFADQVPFLWSHKTRDFPLGHITNPRVVDVARLDVNVSEDATKALLVDVDFDAEDPRAQLVEHKYRRGDLDDSSVGFDPIERERFGDDEPGRFHFLQQTLKEVSAVNIGANPDAQTISKHLGTEGVPDEIVKALDDAPSAEPEDDAGQTKDGRRNNETDAAAQKHAKEMLEFTLGERDKGDIGDCPFHKMGDHDDKSGEVDGDDIADVVEQKVREVLDERLEGDEPDDQTKDEKGQDGADEPEGDGLCIDEGKIIEMSQETSGQSDSSSGDGDAETPETVDELFAQ